MLPHKSASTLRWSMGAALLGSLLTWTSAASALPIWDQLSQMTRQATEQTVGQTTGQSGSSSQTPAQRQPSPSGSGQTTQPTQNLSDVRFSCQMANGQYTVMYNPQSQPNQYYAWATPTALGGGWSPERRCNEISRRLEFYRPDGLLELQTGVENGYNTVCVTTEDVSTCRIVLTVPPGQDPVAVRDRIFNNLLVADSGQQTTAAVAYQDNGDGILRHLGQVLGVDLGGGSTVRGPSPSSINLRPFLDSADGGTGSRLQAQPVAPTAAPSQPSAPRLNPGNFR
ncbi:MAG: COP23 domain-containing protein [Elainella sp.]